MRAPVLFCLLTSGLFAGNGIDGILVTLSGPSGTLTHARTDLSGAVRFRLPDAGAYSIEIQNAFSIPTNLSIPVRLEGLISSTTSTSGVTSRLATGRLVMDSGVNRTRLELPAITFDSTGRSHFESIQLARPADLMFRLTRATPESKDPPILGLPEYLSFVAIEGGPSPQPQLLRLQPVVRSQTVSSEWIPSTSNPAPLRLTVLSSFFNSDVINAVVDSRNLREGLYSGNIDFRVDRTRIDQTVPVYIRILPRGASLPPTANRKTLFYFRGGTSQAITVYNPNPASDVYTLRNQFEADNRTVDFFPREVSLGPGGSGTVLVQFLSKAGEEEKSVSIINKKGEIYTLYLVKPEPGPTVPYGLLSFCTRSKLYPVLGTVGFAASPELGANATVEVYDDCSELLPGARFKSTDETYGQSQTGSAYVQYQAAIVRGSRLTVEGSYRFAANLWEGEPRTYVVEQLNLPALSPADQPRVIQEAVNDTSGEPMALAPGATVRLRCCGAAGTQEPPTIQVGGKEAANVRWTQEGLLFDVPSSLTASDSTAIQIVNPATNLRMLTPAFPFAPVSPALVSRTLDEQLQVPLLKHGDLNDAGDDYAVNRTSPPEAGELVSFFATGLGPVDANGKLVNAIKAQIGGVAAEIKQQVKLCPPECPDGSTNGARIFAVLPSLPAFSDSDFGNTSIQLLVGEVLSNLGTTPSVRSGRTNKPDGFHVTTVPTGRTVRINGGDFAYNVGVPFEVSLPFVSGPNVAFDVTDRQLKSGNTWVRYDFDSWSFGGAKSQTRAMAPGSSATAYFKTMLRVAITGGTLIPTSPDGFYEAGKIYTMVPNCPADKVFDAAQVILISLVNPNTSIGAITAELPLTLTNPMSVEMRCKFTPGVRVTVTTNIPASVVNPNNVGVQINQGWYGLSSASPMVVTVQPAAATVTGPRSILNDAGDVRFDFRQWVGSGVTAPGTLATFQPVAIPNEAAVTYTAEYEMLNKLTGTVSGSCTVAPTIGNFYPNNANLTFNVTPPGALISASLAASPAGAVTTLTNGSEFRFSGGVLTVRCRE